MPNVLLVWHLARDVTDSTTLIPSCHWTRNAVTLNKSFILLWASPKVHFIVIETRDRTWMRWMTAAVPQLKSPIHEPKTLRPTHHSWGHATKFFACILDEGWPSRTCSKQCLWNRDDTMIYELFLCIYPFHHKTRAQHPYIRLLKCHLRLLALICMPSLGNLCLTAANGSIRLRNGLKSCTSPSPSSRVSSDLLDFLCQVKTKHL